ncbi:hypothetical protein RvY_12266 [Ramazzottius varieornatus]|uniref:Reverse transcriptase domain-containing protein n=1 Tax=Ramazzottius varieornatus TaxID=947166 RepID=A0A1D1VIW2_RAMVA|nr:hypothetical protein RvY_12266 [Ramazzottius varieornatus]
MYQYTDDVVIYQVVSSAEDCLNFQTNLDQLGENFSKAGLSLNPTKSQHMRFTFKRSGSIAVPGDSYSINQEKIPAVSQATCLGVIVDRRLSWTAHVDAITSKCRKRLHAIKTFFPVQMGAARQMLFKSLFRSVAEYAISVWNPSSKTLQKQLE